MDVRKWKHDLAELAFVLQSQQLFLEHLDVRLRALLHSLQTLLPAWEHKQQQQVMLEGELDASSQELDFLRREIETLERILARQERHEQQQLQLSIGQLAQQYQQLSRHLDHSHNRLEYLEQQTQTLIAQASRQDTQMAELQAENSQQAEMLGGYEQSEQAYLQLLAQKDQEQAQLKQLYEQELEQLLSQMASTQTHQQSWQQKNQSLGKSLARLAQDRNLMQQAQNELEGELLQQQKANQALKAKLAETERALAGMRQAESFWQREDHDFPLAALQYRTLLETLAGLGLQLSSEQHQALAELLALSESARQHVQQSQQLQPGRLQRWLSEHLQPVLAEQAGLAETAASPLVVIPAGSHPLGDDMHPAERPQHNWQHPAFAISRLLVTNADFAEFMQAGGYSNPDWWTPAGWQFVQSEQLQAPAFWGKDSYQSGLRFPQYPVVGVSWYEALAYASWKGLRLPSEAEWEAAARGQGGLIWPWGNSWQSGCANTADASLMNSSAVGLFPDGASPYGLLDMIGNVFEWTLSLYQPYPYRSSDGREAPAASGKRSLRGCSWNHKGSYFTRAAYRFQADPTTRHSDIGFRIAQTLASP